MFKRCGRCQNTLSADEFGVDRSTADKLTSYCLLCKRDLNHEYYVKNRAQINERDRKSYQESKANKGKTS